MQWQQNEDEKGRGHRGQRHMALALVLALLGVLAVVTTANAYVAKWTETTLLDFKDGTFIYTGLLDLPDEEIESVQLMPVGLLPGDWYMSSTHVGARLANLGAVATGNIADGYRIYVVGGSDEDQDARAEVYRYDVGPDGELSADENGSEPLPEARNSPAVTVHDPGGSQPTIYVVGGSNLDFEATDTVYRAPINPASGEVGEWVLDSQRLPYVVENASAVVYGEWLYVIGGLGAGEGQVYYAPIGASGALGDFVGTSSLPQTLYYGMAVVYEDETEDEPTDTLYFIGGCDDDSSTIKVFFADFQDDGSLSPWQESEGDLPVTLWGHSGVYVDGEIIVTGGVADSRDLKNGIWSTVKVALVDPENPDFRLYDWCENAPPDCTIGAWQTGALLPEVRALHATVSVSLTEQVYIYVLGGQDGAASARDTIYVGTVDGAGAVYASQGEYVSKEIGLGQPAKLLQLEWDTTISRPDEMGLTMQYRYSLNGQDWVDWSAPVQSVDGTDNLIDIEGLPEDVRYFQYQANLSTTVSTASPLLNSVHLYYEVPDPDLAVTKDTGEVISVTLGSDLVYNIHYENKGGWVAEDAFLTEFLPENTTFGETPGWEQVGTSDEYRYQLGDVPWGQGGTVPFDVLVNEVVPPNTYYITDEVEIDYPPMVDAWQNTISDPYTDDNWYEFSNELNLRSAVDLTITDLVWEPATLYAGIWPRFKATVVNTGTSHALTLPDGVGFRLELYIKPDASAPPLSPSDHDMGYCLDGCTVLRYQYVADVSQLMAGESVDVWFQDLYLDPSPDFPAVGSYDIYAQVDVAFAGDNLDWGRYQETDEENNIWHDTIDLRIFEPDHAVYLPAILKHYSAGHSVYLPLVFRSAP